MANHWNCTDISKTQYELYNISVGIISAQTLLAEYKSARAEAQEYETVKQNVDALLSVPKEQAKEKSKTL